MPRVTNKLGLGMGDRLSKEILYWYEVEVFEQIGRKDLPVAQNWKTEKCLVEITTADIWSAAFNRN